MVYWLRIAPAISRRTCCRYNLKRGDGIDLCHAVIGSSFGSVVTLDKHWKRRVEELPKPNGLATSNGWKSEHCVFFF
jgi:hypothetical protein